MKFKYEIIMTMVAFVFGAALVIFVSPHAQGFLGNTFFEVTYPIAYYFTPSTTAILTYISSNYWYKKRGRTTNLIRTNILITITAFYMYGVAHSIMVGITNSITLAPTIFFAFLVFGTIVLLPICIILGALVAVLANKLNSSNKSLNQTGAKDAPPG